MNDPEMAFGGGALLLPFFLLSVPFYAYVSVCLMIMARKTGAQPTWLAWIPIANLYLMCRIGGKSGAWVILLLLPLINVLFAILLFVEMAKALGRPAWTGVLILVPVVNLAVPAYLASGSPAAPRPVAPPPRATGSPRRGADASVCASCGSPVGADDRFCGECATPVVRAAVCQACGTAYTGDDRFCASCGTERGKNAPPAPAPAAAPPVATATAGAEASSSRWGTVTALVVLAVIIAGGVYAYRVINKSEEAEANAQPFYPTIPEYIPTTEKGGFTNLNSADQETVPADELPDMLAEEILRLLEEEGGTVVVDENTVIVGDGEDDEEKDE